MQRKTKDKTRNSKIASLVVILIIAVLVPSYYVLDAIFTRGQNPSLAWWKEFLNSVIFTAIMSAVLYSSSTQITKLLEKYLPWQQFGRRRFFVELILIAVTTIVLSSIVGHIWFNYVEECENPSSIVFKVVVISVVIAIITTAIYEAIYLFGQWNVALINTEKLKKENLQSQFDSLKNQVNPHFLFNSLNTLATIIPEDPDQAVQFVQKLSSVYRYLLQYKDNETVDLKTELDCIDAYFFLQQIRFGANLRVHVDVPEAYHTKQIPPLTLQILVENAIKHNIISQQKPLTVDIYIDDAQMLVTRNNLQKKKSVESSTKIGLQNLMNRFEYIYGQGIDIFETETDFLVKIPLG
jgi:two-component system LytT family sensor kinase